MFNSHNMSNDVLFNMLPLSNKQKKQVLEDIIHDSQVKSEEKAKIAKKLNEMFEKRIKEKNK